MNRIINKNPVWLAFLWTIVSIIIGLIYGFISKSLDLEFDSYAIVSITLGGFFIGNWYTMVYKELIPSDLVKKIVMNVLVIQLLLGILVLFSGAIEVNQEAVFIGMLILLIPMYFFYQWFVKFSSRQALKALNKRDSKKLKK